MTKATGTTHHPHLNEAKWMSVIGVKLAVAHARAGCHKLNTTRTQSFARAHRVLVRQISAHNVGADFLC